MKTETELLRQELARLHQPPSPDAPTPTAEDTADLVARVVRYVAAQRQHGKTLLQCAKELGLPKGRLHYWVYQRGRVKAASTPPPVLRPVQVVAAPRTDVHVAAKPRRFVLHSHFGWELRDLLLPELLLIMRDL